MKVTDITEGVAGPENCWKGYRKVGTKPGTGKNTGKRVNDCEKIGEQQLDELTFLGSECTKDCSGHRAGYEWSSRKGNVPGNSPYSPSFNKGANLRAAGK
jgi:hypothetical protein